MQAAKGLFRMVLLDILKKHCKSGGWTNILKYMKFQEDSTAASGKNVSAAKTHTETCSLLDKSLKA